MKHTCDHRFQYSDSVCLCIFPIYNDILIYSNYIIIYDYKSTLILTLLSKIPPASRHHIQTRDIDSHIFFNENSMLIFVSWIPVGFLFNFSPDQFSGA